MANDTLEKVLGGSPGAVALRLVVLSIIVGVVLSALGLDPRDIIDSLVRLAHRVYDMGFEAVEWVFRYFLLGAAIVVPVWLVLRALKLLPGSRSGPPADPR
ncbi:MAG: DUF6460 domain-containing protein [Flavobacteriaceae bacterium]